MKVTGMKSYHLVTQGRGIVMTDSGTNWQMNM